METNLVAMEISMDIYPKIKNRSSIGICSTAPGYLFKGCKSTPHKVNHTSVFTTSLFTTVALCTSLVCIDQRMDKEENATPFPSLCMCVYFNHKRNGSI